MAETPSTRLDGNALAGTLVAVFGEEMTTVVGTCAACGTSGEVATCVVYARGPGAVARCPACASVSMVFTRYEITCVDLRGLASLERVR